MRIINFDELLYTLISKGLIKPDFAERIFMLFNSIIEHKYIVVDDISSETYNEAMIWIIAYFTLIEKDIHIIRRPKEKTSILSVIEVIHNLIGNENFSIENKPSNRIKIGDECELIFHNSTTYNLRGYRGNVIFMDSSNESKINDLLSIRHSYDYIITHYRLTNNVFKLAEEQGLKIIKF